METKLMQKFIGVLLVIGLQSITLFGQFIGHLPYSILDSQRNNRKVDLEVYYPAQSSGDMKPMAAGVFPVVVFGHGFLMTWSAYQYLWEALVPNGYILVFPKTEGGIAPDHAALGRDLVVVLEHIQNQGLMPLIPVSQVAASSCVMGHSMGGGAAFLAARNSVSITTMVSLAAANTSPSAIDAAKSCRIPALVFSGSNDCVTPPVQHQDLMYDALAAELKTQIYISGGGHCYFAEDNLFCGIGESSCSPKPQISRTEQQQTTLRFLLPWLAYFLKGDCLAARTFQDGLAQSSGIQYRQSKAVLCPTRILQYAPKAHGFKTHPNPFQEVVCIESEAETIREVQWFGWGSDRPLGSLNGVGKDHLCLPFNGIPPGHYYLLINRKHVLSLIKT